jgi:hypothetical protein
MNLLKRDCPNPTIELVYDEIFCIILMGQRHNVMNIISLYGLILLVFVICTYIALERFFREMVFKKEFTPEYPFMVFRRGKLRIRKSHIFALLIVLILVFVLNTYLASFSPNAKCCDKYGDLLIQMENERKERVSRENELPDVQGMPIDEGTAQER